MKKLFALLPIALFAGLIGLGLWGLLGQRPDRHASPLVGKPAPALVLPNLEGGPAVDLSELRGRPVLVNFYASWCAPCRVEHPYLFALSKDRRIVLLGVAYKDEPAKTLAFLEELGDPFAATGVDRDGRLGLDWGLTGVPESYLIDASGTVVAKHAGPLDPASIQAFVKPVMAANAAR